MNIDLFIFFKKREKKGQSLIRVSSLCCGRLGRWCPEDSQTSTAACQLEKSKSNLSFLPEKPASVTTTLRTDEVGDGLQYQMISSFLQGRGFEIEGEMKSLRRMLNTCLANEKKV